MTAWRKKEELLFDENGLFTGKHSYCYDDGGRLFRKLITSTEDSNEHEIKYVYLPGGSPSLIKTEQYTNGILKKYTEYEFESPQITTRGSKNGVTPCLSKAVIYHACGSSFWKSGDIDTIKTYIFEDEKMLKESWHTKDGRLYYEYLCQYDEQGRRIRTLKANMEIYAARHYDENGLLTEIKIGALTAKTLWEEKPTGFNYDMYQPV